MLWLPISVCVSGSIEPTEKADFSFLECSGITFVFYYNSAFFNCLPAFLACEIWYEILHMESLYLPEICHFSAYFYLPFSILSGFGHFQNLSITFFLGQQCQPTLIYLIAVTGDGHFQLNIRFCTAKIGNWKSVH